MQKNRLWKETKSQATLVVKTKLLFVENGDELRECLSDFYMELAKDIELLGGLNADRDEAVFRYVHEKLKNDRVPQAVQLQALLLAESLDGETEMSEIDDEK